MMLFAIEILGIKNNKCNRVAKNNVVTVVICDINTNANAEKICRVINTNLRLFILSAINPIMTGAISEASPRALKISPTSLPLKCSSPKRYEANVTSQDPHIKNWRNETSFNLSTIFICFPISLAITRHHNDDWLVLIAHNVGYNVVYFIYIYNFISHRLIVIKLKINN